MAKIVIAGDYSPKDRVKELICGGKGSDVLEGVRAVLSSVDYSVVNFETTLADEKCQKIRKAGPALSCPQESVRLLKDAGFSCVALANNHFRDYGTRGVQLSLDEIEKVGLERVGGGMNIAEAKKTLYKDIDGKTVAFINACEHEFSIADDVRGGSAPLDIVGVSLRIQEAKENAEYVIVIIHGGNEHYQLPTPRMKKTYRFFVKMGADAVVNHHQHCYSGYESYQGKPIVYGLGNFCFDWNGRRNSMWNEGYLLQLDLDETIGFELIPYIQCNETPKVVLMTETEKSGFDNKIKDLNGIIADDEALNKEYERFVQKRKRSIICPFTPYLNSYVRIAAGRHLLPYLIPREKLAGQINFIDCESHRDVLLKVLNEELEK